MFKVYGVELEGEVKRSPKKKKIKADVQTRI